MLISSKILVTGSTGFLGSSLVTRLLKTGANDLRCFARPGSDIKKLIKLQDDFPKSHIEIFTGDLKKLEDAQKAVKDVAICFNLAAGKNGPTASVYLNTVVTTHNLLEAVKENNRLQRFVHVSSFAVYGAATLPRGGIINEEAPLEPNVKKRDDSYTFVKLKQESIVWKFSKEYGLPVVIVRPGVVYGPGGDEISRRVGFKLLGWFLNIGKNNILPLSYVDNCSDAIILAGIVPGIENQVFNIHDDQLCTCNEFFYQYLTKVKRIKNIKVPYPLFWLFSWIVYRYSQHSKGQIPPVLNAYKTASIYKGNKFDNSKLRTKLGWKQRISTREGLDKHYDYFKQIFLTQNQ